jgi:O-antigen ligase
MTVLVFLASVAASTLVSEDLSRSMRLSAALLPGLLLFVIVADHFEDLREIRLLYVTVSVVALVLAIVVLWAAWQGSRGQGLEALLRGKGRHAFGVAHLPPWPHHLYLKALVTGLDLPILVVPNDLTFLAVVAPLSLVLIYRAPRGGMGLVAAASIVLSLGAIGVFCSRTAALTMVLGLLSTVVLVQPRQRLVRGFAGVCVLLGVALLANVLFFSDSQVITKFAHDWTLSGRTRYWSTAWAMFREAPWSGQGPHTFGIFHRTPWPHNLYLEVLAEQGLVGLLALVSLMICSLIAAWKIQRTAPAEVRLLGTGALAGLIGFWSAGVVELSLLREWVVTTLFVLLGIIRYLSTFQSK